MKIIVILNLLISLSFTQELFLPLPAELEFDRNIVNLGRELFFDPILSRDKDISCATCHLAENYGTDGKALSVGTENREGRMNSLSVFNSIYKIALFWNGRSPDLASQMVDGPIFNRHEMASNKNLIEERLQSSKRYVDLFQRAYKNRPNFQLVVDAISKFEETLITSNSKFDKYLRGEVNLTKEEESGKDIFIGYGCASCHNGINIGGNSYQEFGAVIDYEHYKPDWDDRFQVTKRLDDRGVFRVASLRNIEKTGPYFHDGSINSLKEAINIMGYSNIGISLKKREIELIEKFLKTLTGELPKTLEREVK